MDAYELLKPGGAKTGVFACGKCGLLRSWNNTTAKPANIPPEDHAAQDGHIRTEAERCCRPKVCTDCGGVNESKSWTICEPCRVKHDTRRERARFEKARHLTPAEYGGPVMEPNDRFHMDLGAFEDHYADADPEDGTRPEYVWACRPVKFCIDLRGHVLDHVHEDAADQIDEAGLKELDAFEKQWWEKYGVESWEIDYSRAVVLNAKE
ncbi:hypothetical protein [Gemmata sp.]|uniref:hypothetical protein n=1 Tax=Gemmata sp. TaxID=1914242 RepID=UPI003F72DA04